MFAPNTTTKLGAYCWCDGFLVHV